MALRPLRIPLPPSTEDQSVSAWMREITNAINGLPFSYFSTSDGPNSSVVTAPVGFIGIEVGSSVTKLWIKTNSGGTYWSALSHIGY